MQTIFSLLTFIALIGIFIALISPKKAMFWSKQPTRLKAAGIYFSIMVIGILLGVAFDDPEARHRKALVEVTAKINSKNYKAADRILDGIILSENDPLQIEYDSLKYLVVELTQKQEMIDDSLAILKEKELERLQLKEKIEMYQREVTSFEDGVDYSSYKSDLQSLIIEVALFANWVKLIKDSEKSEIVEVQKLGRQLRNFVIKDQTKEFPKMRKAYANLMANTLWEHDIEVKLSGSRNIYITLIGGLFAANKNIKDSQTALSENLTLFRFKQSRYLWFSGADEYTYYSPYEGKDSDLVIIGD